MASSSTPQPGRTRLLARWFVLAMISLLVLAGTSIAMGHYLWHQVAGRTAAFFVYLAWLALLLGSAAVMAGFLLHYFFPGVGAEGGKSVGRDADEADGDLLLAHRSSSLFQSMTIYYSLLFIAVAGFGMVVGQRLSQGALFDFKVIQMVAMSRSSDPAELKRLFIETQELQRPEEVERFTALLPGFFRHTDESVRGQALQTMAVMAHRMNLSVYLLVKEGLLLDNRWEPGIVQYMHSDVAPLLRTCFDERVTPIPAIVHALARIARPDELDFFKSLVENNNSSDPVFVAAAIGLGNLGQLEGASVLVASLPHRRHMARIRALWALERIGMTIEPDPNDDSMEDTVLSFVQGILRATSEFDDASLCASMKAVRAFQHSAITEELIALFESERADLVCPRVEVQEPIGPPQLYVGGERFRWLLLNVLADVGRNNTDLRGWVRHALSGPYHEQVMRGLRQLDGQLNADPQEVL
jgi:hypothetical protein